MCSSANTFETDYFLLQGEYWGNDPSMILSKFSKTSNKGRRAGSTLTPSHAVFSPPLCCAGITAEAFKSISVMDFFQRHQKKIFY